MKALICLAILWVLWLISSSRWRRRLIQPLSVLASGFFILTSPAFVSLLTWGMTAQIPPDLGEHVDMIVVLGRGSDLRTQRQTVAWQLWQSKRADKIFASGMMDALAMVQYWQDKGVPITSLAGEECSQTTEENAVFTSAILRHYKVKKILLVTDPSHMWRAFLIFRSMGFNVIPHATSLESQQLTTIQQLIGVIREYLGMIDYALSGKFRQRSSQELDNPSPKTLQKITKWNCKVPRK
jgi:uncharacterized SAM-binding protein YcdF (DUF218 family)